MQRKNLREKAAKIALLLVLISASGYAQSVTVRGTITTSSGPVRYASVTFIDNSDTTRKYSAITDTSGNYQIDGITSVKGDGRGAVPTKFVLNQNYPNPFSSSTAISYKLNEQSNIAIKIYNVLGQFVKEIKVGSQAAGVHGITWDGTNNSGMKVMPGVYFCRVQTGKLAASRKMVLMSGGRGNILAEGASKSTSSVENANQRNLSSVQLRTFTIRVGCIDSTKPRIVAMETLGVMIENDTTIDFSAKGAPVALITGNRSVKVGQYTILDGSGSARGDGDTLIYKWTADPNNPGYVYVDASNPSQKLEFLIKGIYRFTLTVNNGYSGSFPETATVTVDSRDKIAFIDSCFEISLRAALGVPNADITNAMLLSLDSLVCISGYYRITSVDGIEKCTNLKLLSLEDQSITDLSLISGLTQLEELYLGDNRSIVDVSPLAGLTNLKELNLESNNVSDLSPLRNMAMMVNLNLINNPVTDISCLKGMTGLEQLWIENPVKRTFFPLAGTSVIGEFTKLWLLWLSGFDCRDLSFISALDSLQYLRLSFCNVKGITPVANLTQLQRLYMDSDSITDISPLSNLTSLNLLDLKFNQITNIKPLVDNNGLGEGDAVSLNGNPLDSISVNQYIPALKGRGVTVFY